jgi:hypothetical protein
MQHNGQTIAKNSKNQAKSSQVRTRFLPKHTPQIQQNQAKIKQSKGQSQGGFCDRMTGSD